MSRLGDRRYRQDKFYQQAKRDKYPARSVYKLQELDQRFKLLRSGQRVLDLGCRPGSWLQYIAGRVGPKGFVVGLDREALDISLPTNAALVVGDILQIEPVDLTQVLPEDQRGCFQLIVSDMAPDTSGIAFADQVHSIELFSRALQLALLLGCPKSSLVGKLFMGDGFAEIVQQTKQHYARTKTVRPAATRKSSAELYLVALEKK